MIGTDRRKTITEDMSSCVSLLSPVTLFNPQERLRRVRIHPERGKAVAGQRRETANLGTLLAVATYGDANEVKFENSFYIKDEGHYVYSTREFVETKEGLPGETLDDGSFMNVDVDEAQEYIDSIREDTTFKYEVTINPNMFRKMIADFDQRNILENRKFNLFFSSGTVPTGMFVAEGVVHKETGEVLLRTTSHKGDIYAPLAKESHLGKESIRSGMYYICKPVINYEKREKQVDVRQIYTKGIISSIQHFDLGLIKPGDKAYSTTKTKTNGVEKAVISPFHPDQNSRMIAGAPMLVLDLDIWYSAMTTLSNYPHVKMQFKNGHDGIYLLAESPHEYLPTIEMIIGPTIQDVRGRVTMI